MALAYYFTTSILLFVLFFSAESRLTLDEFRRLTQSSPATTVRKTHHGSGGAGGVVTGGVTNWAVLVAGSNGFINYRHQSDICHAYQILKKGGLKDENIIVLMYDDIANNTENPRKGTIINSPTGSDVYKGVPKDYTGDAVTASNLLAVILGDKKSVKGGNGKVVASGPNDHIFIYYSDHGSPGVLSMPVGDDLYAKDLVNALKKKHAAGTYSRMVIYVEACEAGSMFDGLLTEAMNIYVTTASNPSESSYATYCPDSDPSVPSEYNTCLGDLYSVAWMEDSDKHSPQSETLEAQYQVVKIRTISATDGSHVMQYGDSALSKDILGLYLGTSSTRKYDSSSTQDASPVPLVAVNQRDADIVYLQQKVRRAPEGSKKKAEAQRELDVTLAHRKHVDRSVATIGQNLFGAKDGSRILNTVRPAGQPLVDDWDCLKSTAGTYKAYCGSLATYGMKYMRAFANICNAGVSKDRMAKASSQACKI
ncbi:hypothetical protein V2J09_008010 [Rumex salicifolius]